MKVSNTPLMNARLGSTNINFSRIATDEVWDRLPNTEGGEIVSGADGFLTIGTDDFLTDKPDEDGEAE